MNYKNIKLLLNADDLVLLSSTPQGLQLHLDLLENYYQNWALAINQHYGLSEKTQMSGRQILVQSRQHCPRSHGAVHLPRPVHPCIREFQYGSECSQRLIQILKMVPLCLASHLSILDFAQYFLLFWESWSTTFVVYNLHI